MIYLFKIILKKYIFIVIFFFIEVLFVFVF
jgi:hypothetical protein